jgi:hypothetical protein
MSDSVDIEELITEVPRTVAVNPTVAEYGPLVNWLLHELHPRRQILGASDDSVLDLGGASGPQDRGVAGPGWGQIWDLTSF